MFTTPTTFMGHNAGGGGGTISYVAGTKGKGTTVTATTAAMNTTSADFIIISAAYFSAASYTPTDSQSNTWTGLGLQRNSKSVNQLFYCEAPTTSSTHTFTLASVGPAIYPSLTVMAFSGVASSSSFDQQSGAVLDSTSIQPGSVTPTTNNQLLVCGLTKGNTSTPTINSSFTLDQYEVYAGSTNMGSAIAYLIQTTASAVNPTWSWSVTDIYAATNIATFKPA